MATARETILWRIRRATRDVPEGEQPEDATVERGYRREDDSPREEIVERFAENVAEYEATVRRVAFGRAPRRDRRSPDAARREAPGHPPLPP